MLLSLLNFGILFVSLVVLKPLFSKETGYQGNSDFFLFQILPEGGVSTFRNGLLAASSQSNGSDGVSVVG